MKDLDNGLMLKISPYLIEGMPNIFDDKYKTNVLGIRGTINENSSIADKKLVIEEYLLMEGFWDSLKTLPGEIKDMMSVLKTIVGDTNYINKWVKALEDTIITKGRNLITTFLENVYNAAKKLGLDKITNGIKKIIDFFSKSIDTIKGYGGWKTAVSLTGLALAITYVLDKVGKYIHKPLKEMGKDFLTSDIANDLFNGLGKTLQGGLEMLLTSVSGIGAFIEWGRKLFNGIKFIVSTLSSAIGLFSKDKSKFALWKDKDINESSNKTSNMKKLIKKLLKEGLEENDFHKLLAEVSKELDFSAFKINDALNPKVWESEGKMKKDVLEALKKIGTDYWDALELEAPLMDITLTGSLANFNWSKYSDADLHMVFDEKTLGGGKTMVKDLLDVKTRAWNLKHDITVKDFEVELYLQPEDQPHHSTGVYSIIHDKWVIEPEKIDTDIDKETVTKKYNTIVNTVKEIKKSDDEDKIKMLEKLKDKIKVMRQSGLEANGEYSSENIVFKLLRRNDIMEQIDDMLTDAYDKSVSLD